MPFTKPRITIAALKGGAGKTVISIGLMAAWRERGYRIAPFKKGPDFIDPGWLSRAADMPCYNLDPFLMTSEQILDSFVTHGRDADLALIEGNRGLYDGLDVDGSCSTGELAKLLRSPVLIILDVTMATRTIAAIVKGCQVFDPDLEIVGAILNRVAGQRQQTLIRNALEKYCGIPVVGTVPRLKANPFPERHMGLVPHQEREHARKAILWAKAKAEENLQLDEIWALACRKGTRPVAVTDQTDSKFVSPLERPARIGIIRDRSFWFYYPENLDQLRKMGAELVEIDAVSDSRLPPLDALYIGGGFPETHARALTDNKDLRHDLKRSMEDGLPVYAECGGFMYLGEDIQVNGVIYPMVGVLPVKFILHRKPQGHGYTVLKVVEPGPYFAVGETLRGHEFHYSKAILTREDNVKFIFKVARGEGVDGWRDGLCKKNILATYTHIHAAGNPQWAGYLLKAAVRYRDQCGFLKKYEKND